MVARTPFIGFVESASGDPVRQPAHNRRMSDAPTAPFRPEAFVDLDAIPKAIGHTRGLLQERNVDVGHLGQRVP